jgi:hypothetical protein
MMPKIILNNSFLNKSPRDRFEELLQQWNDLEYECLNKHTIDDAKSIVSLVNELVKQYPNDFQFIVYKAKQYQDFPVIFKIIKSD